MDHHTIDQEYQSHAKHLKAPAAWWVARYNWLNTIYSVHVSTCTMEV